MREEGPKESRRKPKIVIVLLVLMGWGALLLISALFGSLVLGVLESLTNEEQDDWSRTGR